MHKVSIEITIDPTFHDSFPEVKYGINSADQHAILKEKTVLRIEDYLPPGKHCLVVDFFNKTDSDCVPEKNLDKFITITNVKIGNLQLPRFMWTAEYEPRYPEPWYSEQNPKPPQIQTGATILGFNGTWKISFESPIYPWIHKIENMGWIWPID